MAKNNFSQKLAIFGGNKTISKNINHYTWPPKSLPKNKSVINFLNSEKLNKNGNISHQPTFSLH